MNSLTVEQLAPGQSAEFSKTVTEIDVTLFAAISGDFNPVHMNETFAAASPFGGRIAHGPITLALAAGVLGTELPGVGTVAVSNTIEYRRAVRLGDTITARVVVRDCDRERNRVTMDLSWLNQDGDLVAEGTAVVKPPRMPVPTHRFFDGGAARENAGEPVRENGDRA